MADRLVGLVDTDVITMDRPIRDLDTVTETARESVGHNLDATENF